MADTARCFVAIHLDHDAERAIAALIDRLRRHGAAIRWSKPEQAHLTMKFLGDVPRSDLDRIRDALRAVSTDGPLRLGLEGTGWFPPRGPARVVWAGLCGDVERLTGLQQRIESAMAVLGFEPDGRAFRPHLTLGRVKQPRGVQAVLDALERLDLHTEPAAVEAFVLYESELTPGGAVHTAIERYPLIRH